MKSEKIKPVWIVLDMEYSPRCKVDGGIAEFKNEKSALAFAKDYMQRREDDECWVFKLSHVLSKPEIEPIIYVVK